MKQKDLRRIKYREVPVYARKKDKDGRELPWEVSAPAKLNGGKRYRKPHYTKGEAIADRDRLQNQVLCHGTERAHSTKDIDLLHRLKEKVKAANIPVTDIEALVEREIQYRTSPTNFYRVSDLFSYYRKSRNIGDPLVYTSMGFVNDAEKLFLEKWGDVLLRDIRKHHAEELLNDPPPSGGKPRSWSTGSKRKYRSTYTAVWNFGLEHWTDDEGKTHVPFNPFDVLWFGKRRTKRGSAAVYTDIAFLKGVYRKIGTVRPDQLPAWDIVLKTGLRPESELAGGRSQKEKKYNDRTGMTWGQVHLKGGKFGYGYIDLWCYKTQDSGEQRRFVPLHKSSHDLLALYKPHFKKSDPILPGSLSAFDQVVRRAFIEVGNELCGKPLSRLGPGGERDMPRHTCLSAFLNETDSNGNQLNSIDEVAKWAGHQGTRTLFTYYVGAMTDDEANGLFNIAMPSDWKPPLKKARAADFWYPDEAKAARAWGQLKAQKSKYAVELFEEELSRVQMVSQLAPLPEVHTPKQEKHGPTITNQEAGRDEI